MSRPFKVTWKYQNDEEVLTTSVYYFDPSSATLVSPEDLSNLAAQVIANIAASADNIMGTDVYSHSVEVTTIAQGASGPSRHINAHNSVIGDSAEPSAGDLITMNVQLRGTSTAGKPVTGGLRLAGVYISKVDCNNLEEAYAANAESAVAAIFPPQIVIGGQPFARSIKHTTEEGNTEYVFAEFLSVARRVGTMLDRVGNRPQSRGKAGNGQQPAPP